MEKEPPVSIEQLSAKAEEASKKMSEMAELVKYFSPKRAQALREILEKGNPAMGSSGRLEDIEMLKRLEKSNQAGDPFAGYDIDPATGHCDELSNDIFLLGHAVAAEKAKRIIDELAEQLKKI